MKRDKETLKVELPRFHADYATRQRILDNVTQGKSKEWTYNVKPILAVAAAVILLLAIILPQAKLGFPLVPGSTGLRLAADWHQVASDNKLLDNEAVILALNISGSEGNYNYNLRMLVNMGTRWDEYVLAREGRLSVTRPGSRKSVPANYPDSSLLRLLDQIGLESLADKQSTIKLEPGTPGQAWWGPGNVLVAGAREVINLGELWVEFNGPYTRLVVSQGDINTNYIIPLGNYSRHDLGRVYRVMERQLKAEEIYDITRFSGGWQIDVQLPEGRALVLVTDDSWEPTVNYWDQPRYGDQQIRQLITSNTGLEVIDVEGFSGGYWTVAVRFNNQEHLITVADRDGSVVHREFDLATVVTDGEQIWYYLEDELWAWPDQSRPLLTGHFTALAVFRDAPAVELGSNSLMLLERGESFSDLTLDLVRFSPGGKVLLFSDDIQLREQVSKLSPQVWVVKDCSLVGLEQVGLASPVRDGTWVDEQTIALLLADELVIYETQSQSLTSLAVDPQAAVRIETTDGGLMIVTGQNESGEVRFWHQDKGLVKILEAYAVDSMEFVQSASYSGRYLFYREDQNGLLTTIAWALESGKVEYALEGSVFIARAVVQWLRDELGLVKNAQQTQDMALAVEDTGGVYVVPAFVGLGAPWWDMDARGTITGLTRGSNRNHIVRAALEAIAFQTRDVLSAMAADSGLELAALKVDGGAVANDFLMQFQADMLCCPVERPLVTETTALGAAYLAGLAVGFWKDKTQIQAAWQLERRFRAEMDRGRADELYRGWRQAVERTLLKR